MIKTVEAAILVNCGQPRRWKDRWIDIEREYRHIQKKDYLSNKWPFLEFCKFAHDVSDRSFIHYFVLVVINAYKMKRTTTCERCRSVNNLKKIKPDSCIYQ